MLARLTCCKIQILTRAEEVQRGELLPRAGVGQLGVADTCAVVGQPAAVAFALPTVFFWRKGEIRDRKGKTCLTNFV